MPETAPGIFAVKICRAVRIRRSFGNAPIFAGFESLQALRAGFPCAQGKPFTDLLSIQNFPLLWEKPPELTEVPPPDFWVSIFTRVCVVVR